MADLSLRERETDEMFPVLNQVRGADLARLAFFKGFIGRPEGYREKASHGGRTQRRLPTLRMCSLKQHVIVLICPPPPSHLLLTTRQPASLGTTDLAPPLPCCQCCSDDLGRGHPKPSNVENPKKIKRLMQQISKP